MDLPVRQQINATERAGVNYVRAVVENANSIFHEIHRENDYGNDAFVELVDGDQVTGLSVALQIKSGNSYCAASTCTIPTTERQWNYWTNNRLPVVGIVYDPSEACAYWVSVSRHVKSNRSRQNIVFDKSELAKFDGPNFVDIFLPLFTRRPIILPFDRSVRFAESVSPDEHSLGLRSMFYGHRNSLRTWEVFGEILRSRQADEIDSHLAYLLAHVPGHGDIGWHAHNVIDENVRVQARELMRTWGRHEVLQLLRLMGADGVERGTTGQSVYAVVDLAISHPEHALRGILEDSAVESEARRNALLLLCLIEQERAEPTLRRLVHDPDVGEAAGILLGHLQKFGFFAAS